MDQVVRQTGGSFQEAREWRLTPRAARLLFLLPFAGGTLLVLVALLNRPFVTFLLGEDSIFEYGTAIGLVATAALATVVGRRLWLRGLRVQALAYGVLAVACVLAAGEEISWGQRLLGLATPESVREANLQEELNIHNLSLVYPVYVTAMFLAGVYGSLGSWLVYRRSERPHPNWYLFMPPLFLGGAFLQLAIYRLVRYAGVTGHRYGEWCEFCVAAAIAIFVALNARRLASKDRAPRPRL